MQLRQQFWPLLGNWTGVEEHAGESGQPSLSARAALTFKLEAADAVVVQDYRRVYADGSEHAAHGVFQVVQNRVAWWLFAATGAPTVPAYGSWDGAELTLHDTAGTGAIEHRFTVEGADRLRYRVTAATGDAAPLVSGLTGRYRRVSGH